MLPQVRGALAGESLVVRSRMREALCCVTEWIAQLRSAALEEIDLPTILAFDWSLQSRGPGSQLLGTTTFASNGGTAAAGVPNRHEAIREAPAPPALAATIEGAKQGSDAAADHRGSCHGMLPSLPANPVCHPLGMADCD